MRLTMFFRAVVSLVLIQTVLNAAEPTSSTSAPIVIKNARLFDGKSDKLVDDTTLVIVGNKIDKLGKNISAPAQATVIDAGGRTLMPGLIDAHVHLGGVLPPAKTLTTDPGYVYA